MYMTNTLGPELFNTAVNELDAKKSTCGSWVFVVTELVLSGTQCTLKCRGRWQFKANVT